MVTHPPRDHHQPVPRRLTLLGLLLPFAFFAGCGESEAEKQAKAEKTVCEAKHQIATSVQSLQGLTLTTATTSSVQDDVKSIEAGLKKIKEAEGQLSSSRRAAVEKANDQLSAELQTIGQELSTLTLPGALTKLTGVAERLAAGYREAFAPVSCP